MDSMAEKWSDEKMWEEFDEIREIMTSRGLSALLAWYEVAVKVRDDLLRTESSFLATNAALTREVDGLRHDQSHLRQSVQDAYKGLSNHRQRIDNLEEWLESYKTEEIRLSGEVARLQSEVEARDKEITVLRRKLDEARRIPY